MALHEETIDALHALSSSAFSTEDVTLVAVEGPYQGKTFALTRELVRIGRGEWCDIVLPDDPWVSNLHCECWLEESGVRIRDLRSRNGIKVDGLPILEAYIPVGSKLEVGQSVFQLTSNQQKRHISVQHKDQTGTLIGRSREMRTIFAMLQKLGGRNVNTLLHGETGTGKTSVAKAIHHTGHPKSPFVVVNCGALPSGLIEAALFGHEKGAFTGAEKRHLGFFEQANGGTLFLDEIAELPLSLQPKLLDVLERRMIRRLGGEKEHEVDFRLITATHRNLLREVEKGHFREDLYFRISVVELTVPPLRERIEDLPLLINHFLKQLHPNQALSITNAAQRLIESYSWPGNIRELRNVLERAVTFLEGNTLDAEHITLPKQQTEQSQPLPPPVAPPPQTEAPKPIPSSVSSLFPLSAHSPSPSLKEILTSTERAILEQALQETEGNVPQAAELLHISESWVYNRIKRYKIKS